MSAVQSSSCGHKVFQSSPTHQSQSSGRESSVCFSVVFTFSCLLYFLLLFYCVPLQMIDFPAAIISPRREDEDGRSSCAAASLGLSKSLLPPKPLHQMFTPVWKPCCLCWQLTEHLWGVESYFRKPSASDLSLSGSTFGTQLVTSTYDCYVAQNLAPQQHEKLLVILSHHFLTT